MSAGEAQSVRSGQPFSFSRYSMGPFYTVFHSALASCCGGHLDWSYSKGRIFYKKKFANLPADSRNNSKALARAAGHPKISVTRPDAHARFFPHEGKQILVENGRTGAAAAR